MREKVVKKTLHRESDEKLWLISGLMSLPLLIGGSIYLIHLRSIYVIKSDTDLVLYVFVILAFLYAMFIYYRLCDIRKDITLIVRHIAIAEYQIPAEKERVESKESNALQKHEGQQDL